jgi:hypothetical protein
MFRTITSKFPGKCRRCHQDFEAGTRIRYGGRGRTYHLAAHCPAGTPWKAPEGPMSDEELAQEAKADPTLYGLQSGRYDGLDPFKGGEEAKEEGA